MVVGDEGIEPTRMPKHTSFTDWGIYLNTLTSDLLNCRRIPRLNNGSDVDKYNYAAL